MTDYNNCYIIIKNVPCTKCTQCGEVCLNGIAVQKIEEIIERLKAAFLSFFFHRNPDLHTPIFSIMLNIRRS